MMVLGTILAGIGFLLLPLASNYVLFLLIYLGVISLGVHTGFNQGTMAVVNRWFVRRRGTAFGILSVGIALGGAVITPIVSVVVLNLGWPVAALMSGVVLLVVGLPLSLFMRDTPEQMGLLPDGIKSGLHNTGAVRSGFVPLEGVDYTVRQAIRTASYWLLALGICLRITAYVGVFVHIVPVMVWKGLGEATGGIMVAVIAFSAIFTRFLMGWWGDRWSRKKPVVLAMLVGAISLVFLVVAPGKLWLMVVFTIAFSVTEGAAGLTWALIGDYFGRRAFATLRGGVNLAVSFGALAAPVIAGRVYDMTQSYERALLPFAGLYVAAAVVFMILPEPEHHPSLTSEPTGEQAATTIDQPNRDTYQHRG